MEKKSPFKSKHVSTAAKGLKDYGKGTLCNACGYKLGSNVLCPHCQPYM